MIERATLKQLGWADDLIDEVLRAAEALRDAEVDLPPLQETVQVTSVGSTHIQLNPQTDLTAAVLRQTV